MRAGNEMGFLSFCLGRALHKLHFLSFVVVWFCVWWGGLFLNFLPPPVVPLPLARSPGWLKARSPKVLSWFSRFLLLLVLANHASLLVDCVLDLHIVDRSSCHRRIDSIAATFQEADCQLLVCKRPKHRRRDARKINLLACNGKIMFFLVAFFTSKLWSSKHSTNGSRSC